MASLPGDNRRRRLLLGEQETSELRSCLFRLYGQDETYRSQITEVLRPKWRAASLRPEHPGRFDFPALREAASEAPAGVAFFVALASLLRELPVQPGLVVLGEMTIHGNIQPVHSLAEPLQAVMDNGARKVLLPTANKRDLLEVPGDIVERVDPLFYSDPLQASVKALG